MTCTNPTIMVINDQGGQRYLSHGHEVPCGTPVNRTEVVVYPHLGSWPCIVIGTACCSACWDACLPVSKRTPVE